MASVLVLGGGVAGLAAASTLADAGLSVTLVESETRLGGLAASIVDPRTGFEVDLAPPLFSAAPDGAAAWLARIGAGERLLDGDVSPLEFLSPGHVARLCAGSLPGSLRTASALWSCDVLEPVDRARALVAAMLVRLGKPAPQESHSLYRWLRHAQQSPGAIARLWNPLCVAATGLAVEEVAAEVALPALAMSLGAGASAFRVAHARLGFQRLFHPLLAERLKNRGAQVLTGQSVRRLVITGERVHAVELADGRLLKADAVILALPPAALAAALPESWQSQGPFALAAKVRFVARPSVHLFYDRAVMAPAIAVAVADETVWLVHRTRSGPRGDATSGGAVAALSLYPAAGSPLGSVERDDAIARADAIVRAVAPEAHDARLVHALTATQPAGVLLASPGSGTVRPDADTPLTNAWLAGSWTQTGLPGNLEGAYLSGKRAADKCAKNLAAHVAGPRGEGRVSSVSSNIDGNPPVVSSSTVDRRSLSPTTPEPGRWGGHTL